MILFVCTGNTCRSPMAEAMAKLKGLDAASAGIGASAGVPASAEAKRAVQRHGGDLSRHRAKKISSQMMEEAQIVIPMTRSHAMTLAEKYPRYVGKIVLPSPEIPDPFGGDDAVYEDCICKLIEMVEELIRAMEQGKKEADS